MNSKKMTSGDSETMQNTTQNTLTLFSLFCSYQDPKTKEIFPRIHYVFFTESARAKEHSKKLEEGCYVNITMEEHHSNSLFAKADYSSRYVRYNLEGAVKLGEMHDSYTMQGMAKPFYTIPALLEQAQQAFDIAKKELYSASDRFWENNWN